MTTLPFIRPAKPEDLDALFDFSKEAVAGITSLPQDVKTLKKQIENSLASFKKQVSKPEDESYLFCLEWNHQVIGCSAIYSRIGAHNPFFAYHLLYETHDSPTLEISHEVPVLHFIQAEKKPTEIGTLFIKPLHRKKAFGKLLSFTRFLMMAAHRNRFAPTVIAELRGVNISDSSPFWKSLGRHFFEFSFAEIDHIRSIKPEVIADLFPKHPIYLNLLPKQAQQVVSQPHENTVAAMKLLEKQGFKKSHYIDILDGGPHLYAPTDEIEAVKSSRTGTVSELRSELKGAQQALICIPDLSDFRACIGPLLADNGKITLDLSVEQTLKVGIGDEVRYLLL